MEETLVLTLGNIFKMLVFIILGYTLHKVRGFPREGGTVMSMLVAFIFSPAYNIHALARDFTVDNVGQKLLILSLGVVFALATSLIGFLFGKPLGKDIQDKRTLTYAFAFSNYGYFGLPVIESVFGAAVLADVIVFTIPLAFAINIFGYWLLTGAKNFNWKSFLLSPVVWSPIVGSILGLSGFQLPALATDTVSVLADCMSPVAMLLLGFVMGGVSVKDLLTYPRAYFLSLIRLLLIPALAGATLYLCGVRGIFFLMPMLILSMPIGSNIVVFPESCGIDTRNNAKLVFVSYLLAIPVLPVSFSIIAFLSGM